MISRKPKDSVFLISRSFGIPVPLSLTVSSNISDFGLRPPAICLAGIFDLKSAILCKDIVISPSFSPGKAYFSEFVTSSLTINPQGIAVSIPKEIISYQDEIQKKLNKMLFMALEEPEKLRGEDLKLFVGVLDLDREVLSLSSPIRLRFLKEQEY